MATILAIITILTPLAYWIKFNSPYETSQILWGFIGAFIITVYIANKIFLGEKIVIPTAKQMLFVIGYGITLAISTIFSISPITSITGYYPIFSNGLIFTLICLLIFLGSCQIPEEKHGSLIKSMLLGTVIAATWALAQYFQVATQTLSWGWRATGTLGQPNRLAMFLVLGLGVLFVAKINKHLKFVSFAILLAGIGITFSKTNIFLATIICGIVLIKTLWRVRLVSGIFIFLGAFYLLSNLTSFTATTNPNNSWAIRLGEWQGSTKAILSRPPYQNLFGTGPDTTAFTFPPHRPLIYNQSPEYLSNGPGEIRNQYLHLISATGAVSLFIFLAILLVGLRSKYFPLFGAIALVGVFYYFTPVVWLYFWLALGLAVDKKQLLIPKATFLIPILIAPLILFTAFRFALAEFYSGKGRSVYQWQTAAELNPFFDIYPRTAAVLSLAEKKYPSAIEYASQAIKIAPLEIKNLQLKVDINYLNKNHLENIPLAKKLVELSPNDPLNWDRLGLIYLDDQKLGLAESAFLKEMEIAPYSPTPLLHLGEAKKQQGKLDLARNYYLQAIAIAPNWDLPKEELNKLESKQ